MRLDKVIEQNLKTTRKETFISNEKGFNRW